ncbi:hypothetical protein Z043_102456 [Scleropages formosus]|uniref:Uncharacterized protein n=1 Tax=Scleropages formosus TaxID=113540 RepID=A0A0P7VVC7_SCLFO|nr:hypothetical protein Z043_102456 [Scleropages formosus]
MVLRRLLFTLLNNAQVVEKLSESRPVRRAAQLTVFAVTRARIAGRDAAERLLRSHTLRRIQQEAAAGGPKDAGEEVLRRFRRLGRTFADELREGVRDASRQMKKK